jgi:hypothetical protein
MLRGTLAKNHCPVVRVPITMALGDICWDSGGAMCGLFFRASKRLTF